jgi:hypothetical protein
LINYFIQKKAFLKSGGWDINLNVCDEIDSWIKIARFGDGLFINSCLAYRTLWQGSYNQKSSLHERLTANILIKEKIYAFIDLPSRALLPSLEDLRNYLILHWLLVALKQKNLLLFLLLLFQLCSLLMLGSF